MEGQFKYGSYTPLGELVKLHLGGIYYHIYTTLDI